jgi:sec-independent protein translocase protein TatA
MFRSPLIDGLVVIVILLLIVGPKKLPQLGRGLGDGMREFKEGITGEHKNDDQQSSLSQAHAVPGPSADERQPQPAATPARDAGTDRN